jgi:hypothetical protein
VPPRGGRFRAGATAGTGRFAAAGPDAAARAAGGYDARVVRRRAASTIVSTVSPSSSKMRW